MMHAHALSHEITLHCKFTHFPLWKLDQVPSFAWTSYEDGSSPLMSGRQAGSGIALSLSSSCLLLACSHERNGERISAQGDNEFSYTALAVAPLSSSQSVTAQIKYYSFARIILKGCFRNIKHLRIREKKLDSS